MATGGNEVVSGGIAVDLILPCAPRNQPSALKNLGMLLMRERTLATSLISPCRDALPAMIEAGWSFNLSERRPSNWVGEGQALLHRPDV